MTEREYIDKWLDNYMDKHPNEKIENWEELEEQASLAWYDEQVDKGNATDYDLTAEQEKVSQEARKGMARRVDAYGKERKRERKPNEDKRDIISALNDGLLSYLGDDDGNGLATTTVTNVERQIDFDWHGVSYSVTLTAHRPPKKK